jgi:general secretion pathway protein K
MTGSGLLWFSPRRQRGLALVTVLWVLVLLALIAASFTHTTRTEVNLTRNLIEAARAEALADAGVNRAILGLLAGAGGAGGGIEFGDEIEQLLIARPGLRHVLEARPEIQAAQEAQEADAAQESEAGDPGAPLLGAGAWRVDGTVYAWAYGGGELRIAVTGEAGKIDLNGAPDELLYGLFLSASWPRPGGELGGPGGELLGLDEAGAAALVDAVRDFADADDLVRLNGAEDRDYAAAGLAWGAKDAPFEAVAELQQVLGMTAPLYAAIAPALTVHTGAKGVDARLAPREVLLALAGSGGSGAAGDSVDDYLAARAQAPAGAAPAFLGGESGAGAGRSRARVYTIHAEAQLASGAVFAREAVVRLGRGAQATRIEVWRQGERRLFP